MRGLLAGFALGAIVARLTLSIAMRSMYTKQEMNETIDFYERERQRLKEKHNEH